MTLRHRLQRLSRVWSADRSLPLPRQSRRRPLLEALEDRLAPAVFNVNSTADILNPAAGTVTLRSAIEAANATPGGNTINLTVAGTYLITTPNTGATDNSSGEFVILPSGGDLTIDNTSGGFVFVDGNSQNRVFDINPAADTTPFTVTMQGITIQNGKATDTRGSGGGIQSQGRTNLMLSDCTLSDNTAVGVTDDLVLRDGTGGGLYTTGQATLTDCNVTGNTASFNGGGIFNNKGVVTLTRCQLTFNTSGAFGGGLSNIAGTVSLQSCFVFQDQAPNFGGGGIDDNGTATLSNCDFDGNTAAEGAGIYVSKSATLTGCSFEDNIASTTGGGIEILAAANLANCTFGDNSAQSGGAVYNGISTTAALTDCSLGFNSATNSGGGIDNFSNALKLDNTIVAENTLGGSIPSDIQGDAVDLGSAFNLIGTGGSGGLANDTNGNLVGVANPGLSEPGAFGGGTVTIGLLAGSPAVDAGSNALAVDSLGNPLTTDQRGRARIVDGTVDIGAFEYQGPATITVNTTIDAIDMKGTINLREALMLEDTELGVGELLPADLVHIQGGDPGMGNGTDVIKFDGTLFAVPQTISLANFALPEIDHNVNIVGPGANLLTIDAHGASGILQVKSSVAVSISGLTLANGHVSGAGGAIDNEGGMLGLTECSLTGNSAAANAGGIFNGEGTLMLTGCTFTDNTAGGFGGGISNILGKITLQDCTFSNNHAPNEGGGGVDNFGTATLTNCTFDGNTAMMGGGVWDSDTATLNGCTFTSNSASSSGGGIDVDFMAALVNCTFSGNSAESGGGVFNGGITGAAATTTLTNCTVAFNRTTTAGGGLDNSSGTVTLNNTIVAGNTTNGSAPSDVLGNVDPGSGFNLIGTGGSGGLANRANGNEIGVTNPGLAPLGDYGGHTQTIGLLAGSPALDAGSNALAVDSLGDPLTTDQRGFSRVINGTVDIGAFEYQGPAIITVNSTADSNARDGSLTLREALLLENRGLGLGDLTPAERAQVSSGDPGMGNGTDIVDFDGTVFAVPQTISLDNGELPALVHKATIVGPGAGVLAVDARRASGILVDLGVAVSISGLTLANGDVSGAGGDIDNEAGSLALNDCTLLGGSAQFGGGLFNNYGSAILTDCTFTRDDATVRGGGLFNQTGTVMLSNCTLSVDSAAGSGGGLYNFLGTAVLNDCTLLSDTSFDGGGFSNQGIADIGNSTFSGNTATEFGGGMDNGATAVLNSCTFSTNVATFGGGLFNDIGDTGKLTNCTLSGNSVGIGGGGGGISNFGSVGLTNCTLSNNTANGLATAGGIDTSSSNSDAGTTLTNCTVANNTNLNAGGPGGLYAGRFGTGQATVTLLNTVVAENTGPQFGTRGATVAPGTFTSLGYNLSSDASGNLAQTGDLQNANPLLAPLGNYGGPTQTLALLPGSPAINGGTAAGAPTTDQRGLGREGAVDIGAFESQGFTVNIRAGNNQQAKRGMALPIPLSVQVSANNPLEPVQGGLVTFTAPATGPGGTFPGPSLTAIIPIDGGVATAPTFTVNRTIGSFTVTAAANGANAVTFQEAVVAHKGRHLHKGQTASASFWASGRGQDLIKSLHGGPTATQLGNWLAGNFVNLFGANAGGKDLAGETNAQVAAFFRNLFKAKGAELEAQVLATALSVYVTNENLAGTVAVAYGFKVDQTGAGTGTFNTRKGGAAVGRPNGTVMSIRDILLATDALSAGDNGLLYAGNDAERDAAFNLYSAINEAGHID
jgi:hypothetical protein